MKSSVFEDTASLTVASNFFDSTHSACLLIFTSGKTEVFPTMMMLAVCSLGLPTSSLKLECYANILGDVKAMLLCHCKLSPL